MGMNYYLKVNPCRHCGHAATKLHIGKSSYGWTFALHVIPEYGLNDLPDWEEYWSLPNQQIEDEDGSPIAAADMRKIITERHGESWDTYGWWAGYSDEADFHRLNYSERGPNNLLRRRLHEGYCIGHGEGTWDLIAGEFS